MPTFFTSASHMPCPECGASVPAAEREKHACDPERLLDHRMFKLRDGVAAFDDELEAYLDSPHGRFARWSAEQARKREKP